MTGFTSTTGSEAVRMALRPLEWLSEAQKLSQRVRGIKSLGVLKWRPRCNSARMLPKLEFINKQGFQKGGIEKMKGRKPTAAALKVISGTNRPDRQKNEPRPKPVLGDCPKHLTGVARRTWKFYSREAHWLTAADRDALESFCVQVAVFREAAEIIKREGVLDESRPTVKAHPAVKVSKDAAAMMAKLAAELGFTPSSRSRLNIPEPDDDEELDW